MYDSSVILYIRQLVEENVKFQDQVGASVCQCDETRTKIGAGRVDECSGLKLGHGTQLAALANRTYPRKPLIVEL